MDELVKKFEDQQAARAKSSPGKAAVGREGVGEGGNPNPNWLDERVGKLEEGIKVLEGKLDLLTRLLSERLGKKEREK